MSLSNCEISDTMVETPDFVGDSDWLLFDISDWNKAPDNSTQWTADETASSLHRSNAAEQSPSQPQVHTSQWPQSYPHPPTQTGHQPGPVVGMYGMPQPHGWQQPAEYPPTHQFIHPSANYMPYNQGPVMHHPANQLARLIQSNPNHPIQNQSAVNNRYLNNQKTLVQGVTKKPKRKRKRTAFTTDQIMSLEKVFETMPYIERKERLVLSNKLNIDDKALKVWFQNRRMKDKRLKAEMEEELEEAMNTTSPDSAYNSSESIVSSTNDLEYIESQIKKTDENGLVSLDDKVLETLCNVIDARVAAGVDSILSKNETVEEIKTEEMQVSESSPQPNEESKELKVEYEPISPPENSPCIEVVDWEPPLDEEGRRKLFEIHFC